MGGEKNPTEEQIKNYKMTEREFYGRFYNKSNKNGYVKNNVMSNIIKHCREV